MSFHLRLLAEVTFDMLKEGDKWAAVIVIGNEMTSEQVTHRGVTETVMFRVLEFRCDCGEPIVMKSGDFPGRRKMRDCGCGIWARQSEVKPVKMTTTSIYIPIEIMRRLRQYAADNDTTPNKAISRVLDDGLPEMREETQEKAG